MLDNSRYEQERDLAHREYSDSTWNAWVRQRAAPALPGVVAFTRRVHQLGGLVVLVTGRGDAVCDDTRENLRRADITFDEVLCAPSGSGSDKNARFDAVAAGSPPSVLPPLSVVMWIGDNITDFPHAGQALRHAAADDPALERFGVSWFVLPNPMYGSWERNPLP